MSVLAAKEIDAVVVILTPQAMTDPTETAANLVALAANSQKPVLASWMGDKSVRAGVERLNRAGIPAYTTPEHAVRAFTNLVAYARRRELLYETPRDVPVKFALDRGKLRERLDSIVARRQGVLSEQDSKALLDAYGIPTTRPLPADSAEAAVEIAKRIGYPVVLKILSPQITHKTEVGGVALGLTSAAQVREAFLRMIESARRSRPDAELQGATVQRMVEKAAGVELIVGAKRDPVFGPVIMVGQGGVAAEVFQDHALELPPLNERLARRMLESLRSWPLLQGYRGRPAVALDRLIEVLMRFSYLIADAAEIQEVDINPMLAAPDEVFALDARRDRRPRRRGAGPAPFEPLGDLPLSGTVCLSPESRRGDSGSRAADQAGRRAAVARPVATLLDGNDLWTVQLFVQGIHPRNGGAILFRRLRSRNGAGGGSR